MTLARGTTVRVHRPAGVDRFGDRLPGPSHLIHGCAVAPRTSTEDDARRGSTVIVGLTLYGPHDADLRASDQVEIDGVRYEVIGEPGRWSSPFTGWTPGCEVTLQRVTG